MQMSAEEQVRLQAWYEKWDRIEMEQLGLTPERIAKEEGDIAWLRTLVEKEELRLAQLVQANQEMAPRNQALRLEIELLQSRGLGK